MATRSTVARHSGNNYGNSGKKTAGHSDCCYSFARNGAQKFKEVYALQESETIQQNPGADHRSRARKFYEVEVKVSKSRKNNHGNSNHRVWEKHSLGKSLGELWQDLQADPHWKYEQLSPVQLLEKLELHMYPTDHDELARATWFWSRRPRLLPAGSCIAWLTVALGLPFWLFMVPSIGVPVLIIAAVIVNAEIVRSVRWRRQYELSIDRLIRTSTNGRDTSGVDVFA